MRKWQVVDEFGELTMGVTMGMAGSDEEPLRGATGHYAEHIARYAHPPPRNALNQKWLLRGASLAITRSIFADTRTLLRGMKIGIFRKITQGTFFQYQPQGTFLQFCKNHDYFLTPKLVLSFYSSIIVGKNNSNVGL